MKECISTLLWFMWCSRNDYIFRGKPINQEYIWSQRLQFQIFTEEGKTIKVPLRISWEPPPLGWFKLNIDGASLNNPGMAGIGGVIRNHKGEFVAAFAKNIGIATNNKAELWALKQGLKIVIELEISNVIIETDSSFLFSCIRSSGTSHSSHKTLVLEAKLMMQNLDRIILKFGYRELNGVADYLAKKGSTLHLNEEIFLDHMDHTLRNLINMDINCSFIRCTSNPCTNMLLLK